MTSFDISLGDIVVYLLLSALLYVLPVALGAYVVFQGLRALSHGERRRR